MKHLILPLILASTVLAMPPVLSLTQVALQKSDPNIQPDHYEVSRIEVADINADGSPKLYVYGFDGSTQTLLAWSANKKKSLSQISLPELGENAKGHRGGDEFAVLEGILGRRFPIYPGGICPVGICP